MSVNISYYIMVYASVFGSSSFAKYEHMHVKRKYIPRQGMLLCFKCKFKCAYFLGLRRTDYSYCSTTFPVTPHLLTVFLQVNATVLSLTFHVVADMRSCICVLI